MTLLLIAGLLIAGFVIVQLMGLSGNCLIHRFQAAGSERVSLGDGFVTLANDHASALSRQAWNSWKSLRVRDIQQASTDCKTFTLVDPEGNPFPTFLPGQFLMVRPPGVQGSPARCYSLSSAPDTSSLQITVKRVPDGVVSGCLHEQVSVGDQLSVKAPGGRFTLDTIRDDLVVGIAAGVGITPIASMAEYVVKMQPGRPMVVFYATRNGQQAPLLSRLRQLDSASKYFTLVTVMSQPSEHDCFDIRGRINIEMIRRVIGKPIGAYYLCGPMGFMTSISGDLKRWGVPDDSVDFESFGGNTPVTAPETEADSAELHFARSQKTVCSASKTLLESAEDAGISLDADCRAGACGTCLTKLLRGKVRYDQTVSYGPLGKDECLPCIARPDGDCVVDV